MLQSLIAIIGGLFIANGGTTGTDIAIGLALPSAFSASGAIDSLPLLVLMCGTAFLFALAGSYFAAWRVPNRPMRHALVVGLLAACYNGWVGFFVTGSAAPSWFAVARVVMPLVAARLAGKWFLHRHPAD